MSWLRKLSAIVLLALWLPATSYCALERAGILTGCCSDDSGKSCDRDQCDQLEHTLIKPAAESALVKIPALACTCFICAAIVVAPAEAELTIPVPIEWTPDWLAEWSFEHRTALPARAPSST